MDQQDFQDQGEDGGGPEPVATPEIPWTNNPKSPPYLFRLDAGTVYFLFLFSIVFCNFEAQYHFLGGFGLWQYLWFVLPRVLATVLLAFGSAFLYERYMIWADTLLSVAFIYTSIFWANQVGRCFRIDLTIPGQDEQALFLGEVLEEKKQLLGRANSWLWIPYIIFVTGSAFVYNVLICFSIFAFDRLWRLARFGLFFYIRLLNVWHWQDITAYIEKDKVWVDYSRLQARQAVSNGEPTLLNRFMGQVALQTVLVAVLLLISFLYRLRRDAAREIQRDNYQAYEILKISAFWRAAASHLTLYTAYQIFRYITEFEQSNFPPRVDWIRWLVSFFKYFSKGMLSNLVLGDLVRNVVLTLALAIVWVFIQISLGYVVRVITRLGWWLAEPIYAWLTPWLSIGLRKARTVYLGQVAKDFGLNDVLRKRFLIHALFGDQGPLATYLPGAQIELEAWW